MDAQPYFRIFNPWSQSANYDPDCEYIYKWVPELEKVPSNHIHNWDKYYKDYTNIKYPKPILDHSKVRNDVIAKFKKAL